MTTIVEATSSPVTKSTKQARGATSPAPKAQLPKKVKAAAEAFAKDVAKKKGGVSAMNKHLAKVGAAIREAKVAKAKAKPERKLSAMWVIRRTLAHNHSATVEEISKACKAAGVPKADGTIATIKSDFMQTYAALREAGCLKT